jgi:SAM-dependent methyltransferase
MSAPARIARYYDRSTRRFLHMGQSGAALAIHRPLWPAGTTSPEAAADHVNALVADAAEGALGRAPSHAVDLGCGVGGTLLHLARRWPDTALTGLTLSPGQTALARRFAAGRGLADRCRFLAADFLDPSDGIAAADLAVAIESAVHAPSAAAFARAAAARLRPGGVLVVVDDMLARTEADLAPRHAALVAQFRRGWHLGHVATADETIAAAGRAGLAPCAAHDLTGLLRLDRLRDRLLRPIGPLAARLRLESVPLFANMIGGNALTCAYRAGIMRYRLLAFRKAAP